MRRIFLSISAVSAAAVLIAHVGCGTSQVTSDAARPVAVAASVPVEARAKGPAKLSFNEHIQPILAENCFHCHGPDSGTRKAKLRLDRAEFATVDRGDAEAAIVPGKPDVSPLIERILATDPDEIMPPPEAHKTMKPAEIALLKRWIAEGAEYQEHWSFLPPVAKPPAPVASAPAGWDRNPIDGYILAKLRAENLAPSAPESPARLLRCRRRLR
jgi:mono/diheme cytochrome c family protein